MTIILKVTLASVLATGRAPTVETKTADLVSGDNCRATSQLLVEFHTKNNWMVREKKTNYDYVVMVNRMRDQTVIFECLDKPGEK